MRLRISPSGSILFGMGAARATFRRADRVPEKDFVRTVRSPPAARTRHLRVHARENGLGSSRLGISVGRKFGPATARNRLKRIVREAFRTSQEVRAAGLDIIVVARDAGVLEHPDEAREAVGPAFRDEPRDSFQAECRAPNRNARRARPHEPNAALTRRDRDR